jgi:anthranilate phosphoribosyltransferase
MFRSSLIHVMKGHHLSREEARGIMEQMMNGELSSVQVASLLTALRIKGEVADELLGFAEGMLAYATPVEHALVDAVDTCGTGGDGAETFNISTTTAIVAAAAGVPIAKHGNRAASSRSGSIDVLEALGVSIPANAQEAQQMLEQLGVSFFFAPLFHQAMKHVMPARKELGFRTCFNLLGPLVNPARVKRQLVGVFSPDLTPLIAQTLASLSVERALVVSGLDGLDELTVTGPTRVSEVYHGKITEYELTPEEIGLSTYPVEELRGGDAEENAEMTRRVLVGEAGAPRDVVLLNTAAVLYVADRVKSLPEGIEIAKRTIDSGKARAKLEELIAFNRGESYVS